MIDDLEDLADETEQSVSEVTKEILDHVLSDQETVDEIFPPEEEEE